MTVKATILLAAFFLVHFNYALAQGQTSTLETPDEETAAKISEEKPTSSGETKKVEPQAENQPESPPVKPDTSEQSAATLTEKKEVSPTVVEQETGKKATSEAQPTEIKASDNSLTNGIQNDAHNRTSVKKPTSVQTANTTKINDATYKRQQMIQAQQLTNTLRGWNWNNRENEYYLLLRQINRTKEGKEQLKALSKNLNESINAWEKVNGIIRDISQKEQLGARYQRQLQQILTIQTDSPDGQRHFMRLLDASSQQHESFEFKPADQLLRRLLSQLGETNSGRKLMKRLYEVLKNGVRDQWGFSRARAVVNDVAYQNNLGGLQRKQLQQILNQEIRMKSNLDSLADILFEFSSSGKKEGV